MDSSHDWEIREGLGSISRLWVDEQLLDRESTLRWLRRFRGDHSRMTEFRRLVAAPGSAVDLYDDDEVLDLLAAGIVRRRFHIIWEEVAPQETGGGSNQKPVPAPKEQDAPPPPPRPRAPQSEPIFEEPTFSGNIDVLAIAESQREAAMLGLPFCEECARKAAANKP